MAISKTTANAAKKVDAIARQLQALIERADVLESRGFEVSRVVGALHAAKAAAEGEAKDLRSPMRCVHCGEPQAAPHRLERCVASSEEYRNVG